MVVRRLRCVTILVCCFALAFFTISSARAQEETPNLNSSPLDESAAFYTNHRFGISFRIPGNYTLVQGQGAGVRPGDFGMVPGDPGEYLFAKLERSSRSLPFPISAPSAAALYFGIHLGITEDACLAPLAFPGYKSKDTLDLNGVTFHWSAELRLPDNPHFQPRAGLSPYGEEYFRDYAAFANSVCYELHLRTKKDPRENALSELEAIVATVAIFPRTPAAGHEPGLPETPFPLPDDILAMLKLKPWQISYPRTFGFPGFLRPRAAAPGQPSPPEQILAMGSDLSQTNAITLTYSSSLSDDDAATAEITKLEDQIVAHIQEHQWAAAGFGTKLGRSNSPSVYKKGSARLDLSEGTGRCTMNSPCTHFDSLTVSVYLPLDGNPSN